MSLRFRLDRDEKARFLRFKLAALDRLLTPRLTQRRGRSNPIEVGGGAPYRLLKSRH